MQDGSPVCSHLSLTIFQKVCVCKYDHGHVYATAWTQRSEGKLGVSVYTQRSEGNLGGQFFSCCLLTKACCLLRKLLGSLPSTPQSQWGTVSQTVYYCASLFSEFWRSECRPSTLCGKYSIHEANSAAPSSLRISSFLRVCF